MKFPPMLSLDTGKLRLFSSILVIEMISLFELYLFEKHRLEINSSKPGYKDLDILFVVVFLSHFH